MTSTDHVATDDFAPFDPGALPPVIARYLDAHADADRRAGAADAFAPDARVVDEGVERLGIDAVREWLRSAASEYTYTTTYLAQQRVADDRWVVRARLEGDFPGGVAELRYRIAVRDDLIAELVIAP